MARICDIIELLCQHNLHYCEILTNFSIPKVVFIQNNSEAQHACRAGSGEVEFKCKLRIYAFNIIDKPKPQLSIYKVGLA